MEKSSRCKNYQNQYLPKHYHLMNPLTLNTNTNTTQCPSKLSTTCLFTGLALFATHLIPVLSTFQPHHFIPSALLWAVLGGSFAVSSAVPCLRISMWATFLNDVPVVYLLYHPSPLALIQIYLTSDFGYLATTRKELRTQTSSTSTRTSKPGASAIFQKVSFNFVLN